jgi:heat shock protein HtpX
VDFYEHQERNRRYTAFLVAGFISFFVLVGLSLDFAFVGGLVAGFLPIVAVTAFAVSCAVTAFGYFRGGDMVVGSLLARPLSVDDAEDRELHNIVTEMALASGLPRPRVFVIPDPSPNALATGRNPHDAIIAVTEGALALLDREETQGVVAHEMSHIRNRDTLVMTMVAVLFGGLLMLADWGRRTLSLSRRDGGGSLLLPVLAMLLVAVSPLVSRLLAMAVSRRREYLADATAVELTRNAEGLARALEKIERTTSPLRGATRGTAHLFIVNPLKRKRDERSGGWADLFASHPPIRARIQLLRGMERA